MKHLYSVILLLAAILSGCSQQMIVLKPSDYLTKDRQNELFVEMIILSDIQKGDTTLWTGEYPHDLYISVAVVLYLDSMVVTKEQFNDILFYTPSRSSVCPESTKPY